MKNFRATKLALVVVFTLFLAVGTTFGQVKGVAITPLSFEFEAEKGDVLENTIKVLNSSEDKTIDIEMQAEDMLPQGEEGRVSLVRNKEEEDSEMEVISMARWVEFDEEEFQLEPKEEKEIGFTITVPENASPGGHYAGIIAGIPSGQTESGGVGVTHRVAATALLTIDGEMVEELSVVSFDTVKDYYEGGPITFESRFENTGTVHLAPEAKITVKDIFGKKVAELDLKESVVLPEAIRKVTTKWEEGRLWAGKYTASLSGVYGEDNTPLEAGPITFYAFPWKVALAGLLLVIFFILTRKRWITIIKILVKGEAALKEKNEE